MKLRLVRVKVKNVEMMSFRFLQLTFW